MLGARESGEIQRTVLHILLAKVTRIVFQAEVLTESRKRNRSYLIVPGRHIFGSWTTLGRTDSGRQVTSLHARERCLQDTVNGSEGCFFYLNGSPSSYFRRKRDLGMIHRADGTGAFSRCDGPSIRDDGATVFANYW